MKHPCFLRGESAILTAETARRMTTVDKDGYGLGLQGTGAAATFGHSGSNAGFKCQMVAFLQKGQGAVVLTIGELEHGRRRSGRTKA